MLNMPGGVLYEPDDLNWNARNVPPATSVDGRIVPGFAKLPFRFVQLFATKTAGASTTTAVDILPSIDGSTILGGGSTPVSALGAGAGTVAYGFFDDTNALSTGLTVTAGQRFAWFYPWIRIRLRNPDGVNDATFTLRLFLGR